MLPTVVLLLLCALTAIAGITLILKLVPPNETWGIRTPRTLSREDAWYEVHRFGGYALVVAGAVTVLAVILWSGTLLRPFWRQLLVFVLLLGVAAGATLWYEQRAGRHGKSRARRSRAGPAAPAADPSTARRVAKGQPVSASRLPEQVPRRVA